MQEPNTSSWCSLEMYLKWFSTLQDPQKHAMQAAHFHPFQLTT